MRRREFITLLGGAAAAWPLTARAQQAVPVIGLLGATSAADREPFVAAFRQGLKEIGFAEGQNVAIEYRWAEFSISPAPRDGSGSGSTPSNGNRRDRRHRGGICGQESHIHNSNCVHTGGDSVKAGLVASLNRPGGNATGVTPFTRQLGAKRLELLHAMAPTATVIAVS